MAINFPGSLDNFTNPTSASPINSPSHADQHANANDAIEALEAKVGANNSTITTSHDYKIAQLESLVTSSVAGAKSIYQDVRNQSGSEFVKGTPVYVSGSEGASGKMLISAASNASEATSSKTMGITTSAISNNSNGQVISEGILEGIDTTGAADGDPVWLGVNGAKIYGLVNKPSAPAHLVFLGIVIRGGQANTGSMYVKIQNGFELQEIHNVEISSLINGNILAYDSTTQTWKNTNTLQSTSSTTPLVVKATNSPSVNIFEVQNSSGYPMVFVDAYGALKAQASGMYVNSGYASGTGLVVRGYASQTADLQQWQNSSGNTLSAVTPSGRIWASSMTVATSGGSTTGSQFGVVVSSAASIGAVIKGATSQTANLQEWQNSAGTVNAFVTVGGFLGTNSDVRGLTGGIFGGITKLSSAGLTVYATAEGNPGAIIRGAASQTADLQQWQNSAGTVLSRIKANGNTVLLSALTVNQSNTAEVGDNYGIGSFEVKGTSFMIPRAATGVGLIIRGFTSQTANLQEWQNSSGTTLSYIDKDGKATLTGGYISELYTGGGITGGTLGYLNASTFSASISPIVVRGADSQTANLTEWQNSSGAVVARITAAGSLFSNATINSGTTSSNLGQITSIPITVGTVGLVIRGLASQTANLTEWQNSSGTVLARVSSGGAIVTSGVGVFGAQSNVSNAQLAVVANSLTNPTSVVKAIASQTANLQEWQTSSGTAQTYVTGSGLLVSVAAYLSSAYIGSGITGAIGQGNVSPFSASTIGLVVRGAASQTADLQQWQDSAGTVLASVNNGGYVYSSPGFLGGGSAQLYSNNGSWLIVTPGTTKNGLIIQAGSASQTANLQEWQDSSGNVLSSISSSGSINLSAGKLVSFSNGTVQKINLGYGGNYSIGVDDYTTVITADNNASNGRVGIRPHNATYGTSYVSPIELYTNGQIKQNLTIASTVGLTIKGADSQTANLQEWRQFNNVIGTRIGPFGELVGNNTLANGIGGTIGLVMWSVISGAANFVPIVAKGHSSQSANLQEWQDSSGTVLVSVLSNGRTTIRSNGADYGAALSVGTNSTTAVGLAIRGVASQTADLQQWQNSAGTTAYLNSALQYYNPGRISILDQNFSAILSVFSGNPAAIVSIFRGASSQSADLTRWQNSAGTTLAKLDYAGNFSAVSKSFDIPHPTKENMRLRYASLEGSENGVYIRGTSESNIIELPDYWTGLVHEDSITVSLTSVGSAQNIYVEKIENNKVYIGGELIKAFFIVYGERKDIDKLTVEY